MRDEKVCSHPECGATENLTGIGRSEFFCPDHIDYGMGRAFGPPHRALDAARKAGIGVQRGEADHE